MVHFIYKIIINSSKKIRKVNYAALDELWEA
jgi:hypothetical protein